jgi:hypothetical protein
MTENRAIGDAAGDREMKQRAKGNDEQAGQSRPDKTPEEGLPNNPDYKAEAPEKHRARMGACRARC